MDSRTSNALFFFLLLCVCVSTLLCPARGVAVSALAQQFVRVQHVQRRCSLSRLRSPQRRPFFLSFRSRSPAKTASWLLSPSSRQTPPPHARKTSQFLAAVPSVIVSTQESNDGKKPAAHPRRSAIKKEQEESVCVAKGDLGRRKECAVPCISAGASLLRTPVHSKRKGRASLCRGSELLQKSSSTDVKCTPPPLHVRHALSQTTAADEGRPDSGRRRSTFRETQKRSLALIPAADAVGSRRFSLAETPTNAPGRFLCPPRNRNTPPLHLASLLHSTQRRQQERAAKQSCHTHRFGTLPLNLHRRRCHGVAGRARGRRNSLGTLRLLPCLHLLGFRSGPSAFSKTRLCSYISTSPMRGEGMSPRGYVATAVLQKLVTSAGGTRGSRRRCGNDEYLLPGFLRITGMPYCHKVGEIPGDGNCLFTAIAACLWYSVFGAHPCLRSPAFKDMAYHLRQLAVDTLEKYGASLFTLEGEEAVSSEELVRRASEAYGISSATYLSRLRLPGTWGGGPEIVALSHALKRTICVYEIDFSFPLQDTVFSDSTTSVANAGECRSSTPSNADGDPPTSATSDPVAKTSLMTDEPPQRMRAETLCGGRPLRVVACLGYPANVANEPLHILFVSSIAACRTSRVPPAKRCGDHFMPLFPCLSQL